MQVVNVTPGIVRNLLKTTFYLRIPRQEADNLQKMDRNGQTIPLLPGVDTEIFWKDFDVVEEQLNRLDRDSILKIIKRPQHANDDEPVGVKKDGTTVVDHVRFIDFHGSVVVTDQGGSTAGVTVSGGSSVVTIGQAEVVFATSDWENNQLVVIPSGAPTPGQVGPHLLPVAGRQYVINQFKNVDSNDRRPVDLDTMVNFTTGVITIKKAPAIPDFSGILVISVTTP